MFPRKSPRIAKCNRQPAAADSAHLSTFTKAYIILFLTDDVFDIGLLCSLTGLVKDRCGVVILSDDTHRAIFPCTLPYHLSDGAIVDLLMRQVVRIIPDEIGDELPGIPFPVITAEELFAVLTEERAA